MLQDSGSSLLKLRRLGGGNGEAMRVFRRNFRKPIDTRGAESAPAFAAPTPLAEASAAFADFGTFAPLALGMILVGGYAPTGLLFGFGVFALATALLYRRPIPAQPMKAVAAIAIAGSLGPEAGAAAGVLIGATVLLLAATGLIAQLERAVPRTVLYGIQLALGATLALAAFRIEGAQPAAVIAFTALLGVLLATRLGGFGGLAIFLAGVAWSLFVEEAPLPALSGFPHMPGLVAPGLDHFAEALGGAYLPQLALTLSNALLLTAAIASDHYPEARERISANRLAHSTGWLNLLLAPFGAAPMCHGAGGLSAYHAHGARTGVATATFGVLCLALAFAAGPDAAAWLALAPPGIVAALLVIAGYHLAGFKKLTGMRRECLLIIVGTAAVALAANFAIGLAFGLLAEAVRKRVGQGAERDA